MGHLGLTPQSVCKFGGYKVQGRDNKSYQNIMKQAQILEELGCFCIVLECVPKKLGEVSILRSYAGLYDITPDLIPILDTFENPKGYFVAAGFSGHGLAIGPAVCKNIAEWISTGKPPLDLDAFRFSRFSEKEIARWGTRKGLYDFHSWPKGEP